MNIDTQGHTVNREAWSKKKWIKQLHLHTAVLWLSFKVISLKSFKATTVCNFRFLLPTMKGLLPTSVHRPWSGKSQGVLETAGYSLTLVIMAYKPLHQLLREISGSLAAKMLHCCLVAGQVACGEFKRCLLSCRVTEQKQWKFWPIKTKKMSLMAIKELSDDYPGVHHFK